MTTKNLVATIMAAILSITLLTGVTFANTQADAKSVTTPEATILPSTRVEDFPPPKPGSGFVYIRKVVKPKEVARHLPMETSRSSVRKAIVGVQTSAWKGRGYDPRWENVRKCIVHRESRGNYGAKNRYSSAMGAYQFLDRLWRAPLSRKLNKPKLAHVPIRYWSRLDQDKAFWLVWNNGKGRSNWSLQGKQCW